MSAGANTTPATARPSQLPTGLIGLAFLIVAVVFIWSSSWYIVFRTVHVVFVLIWIGGGALLTILGIVAERRGESADLAAIAKLAAFAGNRIFAPSGIIVVAMGIAMTINAHIGFNSFWIAFGMAGFFSTFLIGIAVLGPMSEKVSELIEQKGPNDPEVRAMTAKILLIARADVAVLLLVVVDMLVKPFQ